MREGALILHFIGLTMGLGTSFAHAFLGLIASKMPAEEATKFQMHSLVLSKMGNAGIIMLESYCWFFLAYILSIRTGMPSHQFLD